MTDTTAPIDQVVDLLRQLHLPHMRRQAPDLLATAKAQRWDPAEAVRSLLTEELGFRCARRSRLAGQCPGGAWRVVGVVDARVPRRRPHVAGNLNRTRHRDVGGDNLVAVDTNPHDLISKGVRNRIGDTTEGDR